MDGLEFAWDPRKARANQQKHGISFDEVRSIFADEGALVIDDPDHALEEERFIIIGFSWAARLLTVCHCYRESSQVIRIISARKATANESKQYVRRNMP